MTRQGSKSGVYWHLSFDDELAGYRSTVIKAFSFEVFDFTKLWRGKKLLESIPNEARLYVEKGNEPIADRLFSVQTDWVIVSNRLVGHWWPMIQDDVQVFDAPLYESGTGEKISGWSILNVTRAIDCVDVNHSVPWCSGGKLAGFNVGEVLIDPKRVENAHIFRYIVPPDRVGLSVICSNELIKSLEGNRFTGLAFIRCRTYEDLSNEANSGIDSVQ